MAEIDNRDLEGEGYDAGSLGDLKRRVAYAAIDFQLHRDDWEGSAQTGFRHYGYGSQYQPTIPGIDHGRTGPITIGPARHADRKYVTEFVIDPWAEIYDPWIQRINAAFEPWSDLPKEGAFNGPGNLLLRATDLLVQSPGPEHPFGDVLFNAAIDNVIEKTGADYAKGKMVEAFHATYVKFLRPVLGNQVALLGLLASVLAAEDELWARARHDVVKAALEAEKAFKAEGGASGTTNGWAIFSGVIDVVASLVPFGKLAESTAKTATTVLTTIVKGSNLANAVVGMDAKATAAPPRLSGSTPEEVMANLDRALGDMRTGVDQTESGLAAMLERIRSYITARDPATHREADFHFDPGAGLNDQLEEARPGGEILVEPETLRRIATDEIPTIVDTMRYAASYAADADEKSVWYRSGGLGCGNLWGPYGNWSELLQFAVAQIASSGLDLLRAGEALEAGLGLLTEADLENSAKYWDLEHDLGGAGVQYVPLAPEHTGSPHTGTRSPE